MNLHPQYLTDNKGKRISVVLPLAEYEALLEELETLQDVKLYDQSKNEPREYMAAEEAFKYIEKKRKKK